MKKEAENEGKVRVHLADRHIMFADEIEKHINDSVFAEVVCRSDSLKVCRERLKSDLQKGFGLPDILLMDIADTDGIEMDITRRENKKDEDKKKDPPMTVEEVKKFYELPEGNGLDFCKEMKSLYPAMKILVCSGYEHWYVMRWLKNLQIGHVSKHSSIAEICKGIDIAMSDGIYYCNRSKMLLRKDKPNFWFTHREQQVLQLVAENYSSKEASNILGIGPSAVESNRKIIYRKVEETFGHRAFIKEAMLMGIIWADKIP